MAHKDDIRHDIEDLQASKYHTPTEAAKGFVVGALPSILTFGAIGAVIGMGLVGLGAMLGTLTGGIAPAVIIGSSALMGAGMAALTGGARAFKQTRDVQHRNRAIDHAVNMLEHDALQQGVNKEALMSAREAVEQDTATRADRPDFLQNILDQASPASIIEQAKNDVVSGITHR